MTARATSRSAEGPPREVRDGMLRTFRWGNRRVMLPMLQHPLVGAWVGSPVIGYFLTLTTTGRRSGVPRRTPLNYAILDGRVYLLCGFGAHADWYRNLTADPQVTLSLPGRVVHGRAAPVADPAEAERAMLAVVRNSGIALVFEGLNPLTATDEQLRTKFAGRPVVRVDTPEPVCPGLHDPGSPAWLLPHVVAPLALSVAVRALRRR
ncbi:nitroreductase family deazaflavin-dependent oxidoreductase [Humibacillus xanthopallidus]|uniref:nitroreductase family deazaflavin-dependent oxidoreductase n=1 Tax=Humibacillus xanthopallidus TaxID=412689 RepID=UPI003850107D